MPAAGSRTTAAWRSTRRASPGPLLDRIDLRIEVPAVTAADLILPPPAEGSAEVAARVAAARERQARALRRARTCRASRPTRPARRRLLEEVAQPDADGLALIRDAADAMRLSARGFHRVLKVARTLADLDGEDKVRRMHLAEALSYRSHVDRRPDNGVSGSSLPQGLTRGALG